MRLAIVFILMSANIAIAQPSATVGAMRGAVVDGNQPVAGALVIATSPALQGEQTAITDEHGAYFLSALPPGNYEITLYYLDRAHARRSVLVQLGKEVVVNLAVRGDGGGELITIQGRAPLVDQGSTKLGVTIGEDFTRNVPTRRTFAGVVSVAPGAQKDLYGTSLAGTTSPETVYVVDGLRATDPLLATLSTALPNEFVSETEIITGGYNAEFGRSTGGSVNVITKRGSNAFHGSVFAHYAPAAFASEERAIRTEGSAIDARADAESSYDAGAELGGPIVRDRVWFHAGFAPRVSKQTAHRIISTQVDVDQDGVPDFDPTTGFTVHEEIASTPLEQAAHTYYYTAKLTGAVDANHQGELAAFGNPMTMRTITAFGLSRAPQALMWRSNEGSYNTTAKWTSKLDDGATEIAASAGLHRTIERFDDYDDRPAIRYNYERSLADFADVEGIPLDACDDTSAEDPYPLIRNCPVNGYAEQGLGVIANRHDDRKSFTLAVTHRARLLGYHVLKVGIDAEIVSDATTTHATGGYLLTRRENIGALPGRWRLVETMSIVRSLSGEERADPDDVVLGPDEELCPDRTAICRLEDPVSGTTSSRNVGTYLQDSWLISSRLTLNLGVRWDHQVGYVTDDAVGKLTSEGDYISEHAFELDNVAPRVGIVHDPTGEGLAKLFAHYGWFYETLPLTASNLTANALFTTTFLNDHQRRPNAPGYDPSCNVDHGTPNLAETIQACTDRSPREGSQAFEFVSPGLRGQYAEEIVLGAEYQLTPEWRVGASYQHRTVPVVIEDVSMNGGSTLFVTNPGESFAAEAAELRTRAQELQASDDPAEQLLAQTYLRRANWLDRVGDLDKPIRNYDAVQLIASLRPSTQSLLLASYTWSANRGNYPGLFSPETGQLNPNLNTFFDLPSLSANRYGPLGLDRPHNLKLDGFYQFALGKEAALTTGASVRVESGIAYTALARTSSPGYGAGESYLLPAGSLGRTPVTCQLDVHAAFAKKLPRGSSVELFVDVFNLLNAQLETSVDALYTEDAANPVVNGTIDDLEHVKAIDPFTGIELNETIKRNPNFGNTTERQSPRTIQLGLRWLF